MRPILLSASVVVLAAAAAAQASDQRSLGAHEHGSGALDIAFEGGSVAMAFEAPGADIVGFEHEAKSAEDRAAIDAAIATLAKPLDLFTPPEAAGCVVTAANVSLVAEGDEHGDHGHEDHAADDHDHGHGHDHDHDETASDDDHDHGHDHAEEAGGHTEFQAEYTLACADPDAFDALDFAYFERFPNAEELDVQIVTEDGAKAFEVERDAPRLDLAGEI
ncbi:MAG: DUF2796 domain-containing protein [Pseudomonadota bacterium]